MYGVKRIVLPRRVRGTIEKYGMLRKGDTVIVAVSGGPDSVALLHVLNSLKSIYRLRLHVAHLEHGIRGEESLGDMRFVEGLSRSLSIPFSSRSEDVPGLAGSRGLSLEAAARKLRYAFLEELSDEIKAERIATGHNANDQAETLLLNLLRGAGMAGLSGIRPAMKGKIIRPLIEASREEIEEYVAEKGLEFRVDSSNLDKRLERNKVRQVLLPLIEKEFNPGIVEALARSARIFSVMNRYMGGRVEEALKACAFSEDGRTTIDLEAFDALPHAVKLFMLYTVVRSLEEDEQVVSFDMLNAVLNLAARSKSGSRVDIGSGIVAMKEFDKLTIGRDLALVERYEVRLEVPGTTQVQAAGCSFEVEILNERPGTGEIYRSGNTAYFDFGGIDLPLTARSWREGDKFVPFGLSGTKKVHDVFIDEKVAASRRALIPIVSDSEGILWVAGVRRAERARITDDTRTILKVTYREGR
jgi:tRNA(Ile)-lysidine synthase